MNIKNKISTLVALTALAGAVGTAQAGSADWASWTSVQGDSVVNGTLNIGGTAVAVTYSGAAFAFVQLNDNGTNYWSPSAPYISAEVDNAPPTRDLIGMTNGGVSTITFSQAVVNPVLALVSWNAARVTFGGGADQQTYNAQYLSSGCGFWGCGGFGNTSSTHFEGNGELHGVVELLGTYTSISFTDDVPEGWHGFTVGVAGGVSAVPVPGAAWMLAPALGVLGWRRRRSV